MSSDQNFTSQQLMKISYFDWQTKLTIGLSPLRWQTLVLIGIGLLALVISHCVVLFNADSYVPSPTNNSTPIDKVNVINIFFTIVLFIGLVLAIVNTSDFLSVVNKNIKQAGPASQFQNPLREDERKIKQPGVSAESASPQSASFDIYSADQLEAIKTQSIETAKQLANQTRFGSSLTRTASPASTAKPASPPKAAAPATAPPTETDTGAEGPVQGPAPRPTGGFGIF